MNQQSLIRDIRMREPIKACVPHVALKFVLHKDWSADSAYHWRAM